MSDQSLADGLAGLTNLQVCTPAAKSRKLLARWHERCWVARALSGKPQARLSGHIILSHGGAAAQELRLYRMSGVDGGFLAAASPTLRFLHLEGLPDFRASTLLPGRTVQTCICA